jgi:acetyl esterase
MPLDPQVKNFLDSTKEANLPPWHLLPVEEVKNNFEKGAQRGICRTQNNIFKEDRTIPSPSGPIPIRIYTPKHQKTTPSPVLIFYHGGGFVIGSIDTHDTICHEVCGLTGMTVVSVGYRTAPEHKYPAALQDAYTAFDWVYHNHISLRIDPDRIALFGDSAGACLCCQVSLLSHDFGGPPVACQALLYPVTDYYLPGTPSYIENAVGYGMERDTLIWFFNHVLDSRQDLKDPYLFPLRTPDFSAYPPTFLLTAEYDPLRDEGELFAQKLKAAGVDTVFTRYNGMIHGFSLRWTLFDRGYDSLIELSDYLKSHLLKYDLYRY